MKSKIKIPILTDLFRDKTDLDIHGYCIHMCTGKDLGDMCGACAADREIQFDYKLWGVLFKLPFSLGYKMYRPYNWVRQKRRGDDPFEE